MKEEMEQKEMHFNLTTPHTPLPIHTSEFRGYYVVVPLVLLTLIGCIVVMVVYIRRRLRLDDLRHRLIPLYNYDPAEDQDDWLDANRGDEEKELSEPLYKYGNLSINSPYGT
ncbi:small integral membrane protein 29-like [Sphaeramia orbicularis]|uniref:small integral membrane protein 29-like n=1 Tax=Sphaeramia orbicularis TaxID=375764 RepID=UPI00117DEBC3|nr:small integral membrane protein 29-like [Sphaeramia orbicularis]XP_029992770.1 small integral membrane protein 29-like [Sphaeramia orbicularis]